MKATHKELFEALIYDENISDNIDVCDTYEPDRYGNKLVTLSFEGSDIGRKKGAKGMLLLVFNKRGRLVTIEVATCKKGKKEWQVATSDMLTNFKQTVTGVDQ